MRELNAELDRLKFELSVTVRHGQKKINGYISVGWIVTINKTFYTVFKYNWQVFLVVECEARVKDRRTVSDSGGHREQRYVIETRLALGDIAWDAELTLTDRDSMRFRMLLGRTALHDRFLVDPAASYRIGAKPRKKKSTSGK